MPTNKRKKRTKEPPKMSPIEELIGTTLLAPKQEGDTESYPTKSTKDVFKGKEFVLLYFSAVSHPCTMFAPMLKAFYENHADTLEVVYVSSDKTLDDFDENYANMSWVAIPNDDDGFKVKKKLAELLKVQKIPVLIILQVETGLFVTNKAHLQIRALADKDFKEFYSQKVIDEWKDKKAVPIKEGAQDAQIDSMLTTLLKSPAWIFLVYYGYKWYVRNYKSDAVAPEGAGDGEF